jgi:NADH-quinone oxidoreductase subunit C
MPDVVHRHPERSTDPQLVAELSSAAGEGFIEAVSADDMDEVALLPGALHAAIEVLRAHRFNHLLDIGATDHHPLTPRFEITYHLAAIDPRRRDPKAPVPRFRLRVFGQDSNPVVPSLAGLWPSANWAERELFDLFGIRFEGHPGLTRIMMPDDWEGHPLRKDYPLRGTRRRFVPGGHVGPVPPLKE